MENQPDKGLENKVEFDPDFSPNNPINIKAAQDHNLTYYPERKCYVDDDGCEVRDCFGQPY